MLILCHSFCVNYIMNFNKKTNIGIISHFAFKDTGENGVFPQNVRNFFSKKIGIFTLIDHPFPLSNLPASKITMYKNDTKVYQLTSPKLELPTLILFMYQFFLTIFFLMSKPTRYDLIIACDNLSLISVYILRKVGVIKKLVYYTVDYTPKRYMNPFLNSLYQQMDRQASKLSDINWVTVENMITAKVKNGLNLGKSAPFSIVPIGFNKEEIVTKPIYKVDRFHLVFVGVLYEKQGLQLIIEVLPKLIKKFPKVRLTIIGSGPFENELKKSVSLLNLNSYVIFYGYINSHKKIVELLTDTGGIGLATYVPSIGDFSYYADPSKIKLYLLCGLPIITTNVPPIAKIIMEKNAGFVINYSQKDLIDALDSLLGKEKIYSMYRKNALQMANAYDNKLIFEKAFKEIPNSL